jgi:tRNA-Thr(GGU) m(6)t(6)A37 methyltransferase TsaA
VQISTNDFRTSGELAAAPALRFIGVAQTPWHAGDCPKNIREARERNRPAVISIAPAYRAGLVGISRASHLILLGWFGEEGRETLVVHPPHLAAPCGVFALRAPVRPNPIAVSIAAQIGSDLTAGTITVDALDWHDGTPLLDIKPYYASVDAIPDAVTVDQRTIAPI